MNTTESGALTEFTYDMYIKSWATNSSYNYSELVGAVHDNESDAKSLANSTVVCVKENTADVWLSRACLRFRETK